MEMSQKIYGGCSSSSMEDQKPAGNGALYGCEICGKLFMHRRTLKRHELTHTATGSFTCFECGKVYAQAYDLERHCRLHRGDRPYHCDVCQRSFSMSHHLTNHMVTHTGVRAFSCLVCTKRFAQTFSLKRHMRMHLRLADQTPAAAADCKSLVNGTYASDGMALLRSLSCGSCGKVFSSPQTLKRHACVSCTDANAPQRLLDIQSAAESVGNGATMPLRPSHVRYRDFASGMTLQPPQQDKPYACTECEKRFAHPYSLKRHRIEHGDSAHVCSICCKRFGQLYELDRHMKSHRNGNVASTDSPAASLVVAQERRTERSLSCGICARSFMVPQEILDQLALHGMDRAPCCEECLSKFVPSFSLKVNINMNNAVLLQTSPAVVPDTANVVEVVATEHKY